MIVTLSSIYDLTKQNMLLAFSTPLVVPTEKFQRNLEILLIFLHLKTFVKFYLHK